MDTRKSDLILLQAIIIVLLIVLGSLIVYMKDHKNNIGVPKATTRANEQPNYSSSPRPSTSYTSPNTYNSGSDTTNTPSTPAKVTCVDVTSYDYNWNNDVLCTNPDGSTFYTSYEGAQQYGYNF